LWLGLRAPIKPSRDLLDIMVHCSDNESFAPAISGAGMGNWGKSPITQIKSSDYSD
jgi:hypothetical protein